MEYKITYYHTDRHNRCRFVLGTKGERPLIVVGLNPSTADDGKPDMTITKVMNFAEKNRFDSFIMFNLYPQRTPYPQKLHARRNRHLHQKNMQAIESGLSQIKKPVILAGWGVTIGIRPYLLNCLKDLYEISRSYNTNWLKIGDLTKSGHPRHPSRAGYLLPFTSFDLEAYSCGFGGIGY